MSEWQPIETAPKDGRLILVFEPPEPNPEQRWDEAQIKKYGNGTWVAYWCAVHYERRGDDQSLWEPTEWGWVGPHEGCGQYHPTRWMPLPEAPK